MPFLYLKQNSPAFVFMMLATVVLVIVMMVVYLSILRKYEEKSLMKVKDMVKFMWFKDLLPEQLTVKQVYGIAFSDDKRVVLRIEDGKYKLTGGKPENAETFEETLKREYIEELNIELEDIYYLGYLLVEEDSDKYAQVRMIAKIKDIHDSHIDPATEKIYGRELVAADRIKDYLNYADLAGNEMIDDALQLAMNNYF